MSQKKIISFTATITLPDDCPHADDGFIVPALREAFHAMMVKGLFDQSFSPAPHLYFESTSDGSVQRYPDTDTLTGKRLDASDLMGFTGIIDGKYKIAIDIAATTEAGK